MKNKTILLMLVLMLISTNALSQNFIYGTVTGDVQAGIPINVFMLNCGAPQPYAELTTDAHGDYATGDIANGRYLVVPEAAGYSFAPVSSWANIPQEPIQHFDFTAVETVQPFMDVMPIAICEEAVYNCNIGRMFPDNDQTARWTDFTQENTGGCGTADIAQISDLVADCSGNPTGLSGGQGVSTTNGISGGIYQDLQECFFGDYDNNTAQIMNVTLPVIDCTGSNNCRTVVGAVNVDIVWVKSQFDPQYNNAPTELWSADGEQLMWQYADNGTNGEARWADFVEYFNLQDAYGNPAVYNMPSSKTIYLKPSCD